MRAGGNSAEEDGVVTASATQTSPPRGLDRIDQRTRPLDGQYNYTPAGAGVHAYVIDTGIRKTHAQFGGRAGGASFSSINDGNGSDDCNGHGTHAAGTVGASAYGVAKGVTLHAVRVLDCRGNGTDSTVISGVDWVTAKRGFELEAANVRDVSGLKLVQGGGAGGAACFAPRRESAIFAFPKDGSDGLRANQRMGCVGGVGSPALAFLSAPV